MKRRQTLWLGVHCFQSTETRRKQASNYETVFSRDFPQTISSALLNSSTIQERCSLRKQPYFFAPGPSGCPGAKKDGCFRRLGMVWRARKVYREIVHYAL